MSGIGQRWRISLQPQTCCSTSLHAHAYAQIRTQNSVVNFYRSAHAFLHHPCPATLLPSFWVCTWPQDMVAPSCWFKAEEDQATALWATPASQGCLEALGHPSSLNLPALDQPSQRLGPRSSGSVSCCHLAEELFWWLCDMVLVQTILRESFQAHYWFTRKPVDRFSLHNTANLRTKNDWRCLIRAVPSSSHIKELSQIYIWTLRLGPALSSGAQQAEGTWEVLHIAYKHPSKQL